jgi:2-polyprenyl-3-methyl-5-hydroxy-6-metoxy-1,4-benzoquinol methylase
MREEPAPNCILCGSAGEVVHERVEDRVFGVPGEWKVRSCPNPQCAMCWLDPKPIAEDIHESYSDYYTHAPSADTPPSLLQRSVRGVVRGLEQAWLVLLGLAKARRDIEFLYLSDETPGKVLEVGCGDGARLAALAERGWSVTGQEVDDKAGAVAAARGFEVHVGDLEAIGLPADEYDAVVMNHVLEHVHDPVAVLAECRRLLRPGGVFVAATPNPESYGHRKFGASWRGLEPPRHLHLFPPTAAHLLAQRAGFERLAITTSPARASYIVAASREIEGGRHDMGGPMSLTFVLSATWYQLVARLAQLKRRGSGEETILRAR